MSLCGPYRIGTDIVIPMRQWGGLSPMFVPVLRIRDPISAAVDRVSKAIVRNFGGGYSSDFARF